ncbi:MAG: type II toxin-antitoxin system VapC family toxin [Nocardioidaceae bacterium]
MRLILDTHILLWWWDDFARLPNGTAELIADPEHEVFVSAVSIAEIAVKKSIGRLEIGEDFAGGLQGDGFAELALTATHSARVATLPLLHRDPFDRLLVAQAQIEEATLVTVDTMVKQYDVRTLP